MSTALREDPSSCRPSSVCDACWRRAICAGAREAMPALRGAGRARGAQLGVRAAPARRALRDVEEGTEHRRVLAAPTWKRVAVIAAGPLDEHPRRLPDLLRRLRDRCADRKPDGTRSLRSKLIHLLPQPDYGPGDPLVAVSGHPTPTFAAVSRKIRSSHAKPITVTVERGGKRVTLGPRPTIFLHGKYIWGFSPQFQSVSYSPGKSARLAADDCWRVVTGTATALKGLFSSSQQRAQISGPVGIVRSSQQALQIGFNWYLQLLGLISMSLALLNLLPLLPLDGGHILFSLIESVRRRALAREVYERVSFVGMALIVILMYIALHNDVTGAGPR